MSVHTDCAERFQLPVVERLELVPEWQLEELRRRQATLDAGEMELIAWEEVKRRAQGGPSPLRIGALS